MQQYKRNMTIRTVSRRLKVPKHTLRFWEKEFNGTIVPHRTKGGQRRYSEEHVLQFENIIRLKASGLSLAEIKEDLDRKCKEGNDSPDLKAAEILADRIAEKVRSTVYNFFNEGNRLKE